MAIDQSLNRIHAVERDVAGLREQIEARSGGGGGEGGQVEQRVTRLEGQFDKLGDKLDRQSDRIGGIEKELATLTERVAHLPSKGFIVSSLATTVGVISGLAIIAQRLGFFG
ncbi:hypothetical protein [Alteriqipengyuania lutimaris]|uniref:Uncharacterized protein n=1 Tax=Alteriqipengyuania lutimaris TaxID=1538146 RepID=A0A395LI85_9SPHN|nr:hypothetical protein [Alteriqipengyuania lutimaris]MBB3035396.1 archaellum component FlaC [Alteriqipengyuania lutimaris]RDS75977.1 hypothetical protein DL238_15005 [Alteriqipengyuania lutimaris]